MKTLEKITGKEFLEKVVGNKWLVRIAFLIVIVGLSAISYGKAFDYYFWRDEAKVVWMQRYVPAEINSFTTLGTARARMGSVFFDYLEYTFFGFESAPHQSFGFFLRLANIPLIFLLSKLLFKSNRVAAVSALLAAGYIGGLESYSWVRGIGAMITLSLISLCFYIKSYSSKSKLLYIGSIIATALAFSMDIWRTVGILFIIVLWELLQIVSKSPERHRLVSIARAAGFLIFQFFVLKLMLVSADNAGGGAVSGSAAAYVKMALEGATYEHFFTSLGNLIRIPFFFVHEEGGLADGDITSTLFGLIPVVILAVSGVLFLLKRDKKYIPWIILSVWIPLFYGPNWLYSQLTEVASTHRYVGFSAVVIPIIWAKVIVSKLPVKLGVVAVGLIIFLSLQHAQIVVERDYSIRGRNFVLPYWHEVVNNTPPGETNSILSITGDNRVVGYVFAWSDVFPYGTLKGLNSLSKLPIYANVPMAADVICNPKALIHDPISGNNIPKAGVFSVNKAHAWVIKYDKMHETTDSFRIDIAKNAQCLWKKESIQLSRTTTLTGVSAISLKQTRNTYAFLVSVKSTSADTQFFTATLSEKGSTMPLDIKTGKLEINTDGTSFGTVIFEAELKEGKQYTATVNGRSFSFSELLSLSTPESKK